MAYMLTLKVIRFLVGMQPDYHRVCCVYVKGTIATEPTNSFKNSTLKGAIFSRLNSIYSFRYYAIVSKFQGYLSSSQTRMFILFVLMKQVPTSKTKIKECVFFGPKIKAILSVEKFENK